MLMSLIKNLNLTLNHSVPFLMILTMNWQLDADEFDHESELDFACYNHSVPFLMNLIMNLQLSLMMDLNLILLAY